MSSPLHRRQASEFWILRWGLESSTAAIPSAGVLPRVSSQNLLLASSRYRRGARVPQTVYEMEGGSLADLAGMMGLSSINITDSINKERERRSSNLSDSSDGSVVSVSLSLDGGVVQVTLDTSAFGEA